MQDLYKNDTTEDKPKKRRGRKKVISRYFYRADIIVEGKNYMQQIEIDNEYINKKEKEFAEANLKCILNIRLKKIIKEEFNKNDIKFNFYKNDKKISFCRL